MANGVLDVRESEMSEILSHLRKSFADIDKVSQNLETSFSNVTRTGLLSRSTSKISNQARTIAQHIQYSSDTVSKSYENMYYVEKILQRKAEEINAPTDFYKRGTSNEISITTGDLSKEDGKSINEDKSTDEKELEFNNSLNYVDKLKSIVKDYEATFGEINIDVDKVEIKDITKEEVTVDKEMEDSVIEKKELENINNKYEEKIVEFDDNFEINKKNLEAINNNTFETNYEEINKDVLENIENEIKGVYNTENHSE